jgi:hypothetical protein
MRNDDHRSLIIFKLFYFKISLSLAEYYVENNYIIHTNEVVVCMSTH